MDNDLYLQKVHAVKHFRWLELDTGSQEINKVDFEIPTLWDFNYLAVWKGKPIFMIIP